MLLLFSGILSVCDNCSSSFHWSCLDKIKNCPQCQVVQINPNSLNNSRSNSPCPTDDAVSKVLGDTSKPPTRVSSKEVIERYFNRNTHSSDEAAATYAGDFFPIFIKSWWIKWNLTRLGTKVFLLHWLPRGGGVVEPAVVTQVSLLLIKYILLLFRLLFISLNYYLLFNLLNLI